MNVAVAGTGYVGLVASACLAEAGNEARCAPLDDQMITRLDDGSLPLADAINALCDDPARRHFLDQCARLRGLALSRGHMADLYASAHTLAMSVLS